MTTGYINHTLQSLPTHRPSRPGRTRQLLMALANCCRPPQAGNKPVWMHVPDRTWRRHSALLMTLHEKYHDRGHG